MQKNAQASIEYLVITAFMLVVAAIIFIFALFSFNESSNIAKAQDAVAKIVNYSNLVSSLGDGSVVYFSIELPNNVQSFSLTNHTVNMIVFAGNADSDVFAYTKPSLTPVALSINVGRKYLSATYIDGNVAVEEVE